MASQQSLTHTLQENKTLQECFDRINRDADAQKGALLGRIAEITRLDRFLKAVDPIGAYCTACIYVCPASHAVTAYLRVTHLRAIETAAKRHRWGMTQVDSNRWTLSCGDDCIELRTPAPLLPLPRREQLA